MTEDEMMAKVCHRSLDGMTASSNPQCCIGSRCMAFRLADKQEYVPQEGGIVFVKSLPGAGCYCADLKNDPWPVPGP